MRYLLIIILFFQIACSSSAQQTENIQQVKAERKPFKKSSVVIKSPTNYIKRETEGGKYDPNPKVIVVDEKAGKYELRWTGYDGKEKIIKYQKQDAINAIVEAKIEKNKEGKFVYEYLIKNLPTSPTYLHSFTVQTLAEDATPIKLEDIFIGDMAKYIPDFSEGIWWYFSYIGQDKPKIEPGESIVFSLASSALPGIVGCRATAGEHVLKGVGEHMPTELEVSTPGYDGWAKGYTIGPIDRLATLSKSERAKYILENLPKFQEAGWMAGDTIKIYESILQREDLAGAFEQAKKDFDKEFITSEVFHIIEGLSGNYTND